MRFSQILSESEKELYEAQTAALLQPNKKANFGAAPTGYSGTTTKVNPSNIQTPQKKSIPAATPVKGAYSSAGSTAPAAPGTNPNKAATAAPQPAGGPGTGPNTADPAGRIDPTLNPAPAGGPAPNPTGSPGTGPNPAPAGGPAPNPTGSPGTGPNPAPAGGPAPNPTGSPGPAPSGGKFQKFLRGAKTTTDALGGAIRGTGNLASQVAGGIGQTASAGIGGFQRGLAGGKQGQNFSSIAPTYGGGSGSNSADNIVSQQAAGAGASPSAAHTAAGNAELADLRSRLDSLEQLIKSKP